MGPRVKSLDRPSDFSYTQTNSPPHEKSHLLPLGKFYFDGREQRSIRAATGGLPKGEQPNSNIGLSRA
jgi:hypothetical protein